MIGINGGESYFNNIPLGVNLDELIGEKEDLNDDLESNYDQ